MRMTEPALPSYAATEAADVGLSDQRNYWTAGYEGLMLTDTAFLRNKAYHTDQDTPDRLDYPRMAQAIQGVFNAAYQLAKK